MIYTDEDDELLQELLEEELEYIKNNYIDKLYPDVGTDGSLYGFREVKWDPVLLGGFNHRWPRKEDEDGNIIYFEPINPKGETWSKHLYPQQVYFFKSGLKYKFRCMMAANQVGKSTSAGYEIALHATGIYPDNWDGIRYDRPVNIVCAGVDFDSIRNVIQEKLLGPIGEFGTGLIRKDCLDFDTLKEAKKADTIVSSFFVKHISGELSKIEIKSYKEGVRSFFGMVVDIIWLDEEPPLDIYEECKTRLITTDGILMLTFTPLAGMSETVETFLGSNELVTGPIINSDGTESSRIVVRAEWLDVPHITYTAIKSQLEGMSASLRDAKSKGIPALGSGPVYPQSADIFIDPIDLPTNWKRVVALDFGWEDPCAMLWCAIDPDDGTKYFYSEHYLSQTPTAVHVQAKKQRDKKVGYTIPILCDPSGGGKNANDGKLTKKVWREDYGVELVDANNSIAPGIQLGVDQILEGKIKVFNTLTRFIMEYKRYRYEKAKLMGPDHLLDCFRYILNSGEDIAESGEEQINNYNDYLPTHKPRF